MLLFCPRTTVCLKKSMVPKRKWWYHLYNSSRPTDVHPGFCCPIQSHSSPSHVGPDPSLRRQQTAMASEGNRGNDAGYHWVAHSLHPNPKKRNTTRVVFFKESKQGKRLQCWGRFFGQKVELSEVICWFYGMKGSRLQTEHFLASLVDFSGCKRCCIVAAWWPCFVFRSCFQDGHVLVNFVFQHCESWETTGPPFFWTKFHLLSITKNTGLHPRIF